MSGAPRRPRRAVVLLAAAAGVGAAGLAGCGTDQAGSAGSGGGVSPAAATTSAAPSAAGSSSAPAAGSSAPSGGGSGASAELATGLLPESAFGDDAEVHTWDGPDGHHGFPGWHHGGHWPGVDVEPGSCATALAPLTDGLDDDADDVDTASRTALADGTVTVEALAQGTVPTVDQLRSALAACPTASIGGPGPWQVTFTVTELDVPALGDGSLAVRTEVDATGAPHHHHDGDDADENGSGTRSALLGVAQDGDRLVFLMSTRKDGGAPDEAAFRDLFQRAYQVQADALD